MAENKYTVLIIDDDEFFREFYRAELSQHNFTVEFAVDGEEGINKALELRPNIIMLDIILPKKDGFEVLKDLKQNPGTKDIPVIITSTLSNNTDIHKLLEMGAINNFNKTSTLPRNIALYISDVLKNGIHAIKISPELAAENDSLAPIKIPREKAKLIFDEGEKEIEKALSGLLGSAVTKSALEISDVTFLDLEAKIKQISSEPGSILIYSEIQARKPSLVALSIKRDDALSLIKLLEKGSLGNYMAADESNKMLESFFNIMLTALVNKLSSSLSGTILSKPPIVASSEDLFETFKKMNSSKDDYVILMQAIYLVESVGISLSLLAFFGEEVLVSEQMDSKAESQPQPENNK